jgi:hypothetical protein
MHLTNYSVNKYSKDYVRTEKQGSNSEEEAQLSPRPDEKEEKEEATEPDLLKDNIDVLKDN